MEINALYNSANGKPTTLLYEPDIKFTNEAAIPCIA